MTFVDHLNKVDENVIYRTNYFDAIFTGDYTDVVIKNKRTGVTVAFGISYTWTVNDVSVKSFRVTYELPIGGTDLYYVEIDGVYFSDHVIKYGVCDILQITSLNSCSNQYHDWDNNGIPFYIAIYGAEEVTPEIEKETYSIITANGEQVKNERLKVKNKIKLVAPCGYIKALESLTANSENKIILATTDISMINIQIEAEEQGGGTYSIFTITYEVANVLTAGNTCCDDINIDDILSHENPDGSDCGAFAISIDVDGDTLTAVITDAPTGTINYKWYKDNVFIASSESIEATAPGNYRLDVKIGQCRLSVSYYKEDPCDAFDVDVYGLGNFVNADVSNVPDGCTPTYSVLLNGVEVATSVPFEVAETGTYFVKVIACECEKSGGVFINYSEENNCDFTVAIDQTGNTLEADTDATTPTYLWELETGAGRNSIGTASTQEITLKGIYFLTVTEGSCSKEAYLYIEPLATAGSFARYGGSGTAFTVVGINLLNITNYAGTIQVSVNGVIFSHVAGSPGVNQYTVNGSGQIVVATALTNPSIIITLI